MTDQIKSDRLVLRPYRASDAEAVVAQIGDFAVCKWLTHVPYPYGVADAYAFFDRAASEPFVFAVTCDDALVGCVSVMGGDLGYWYGTRHWGKGYATEAGRAAVSAYFAQETTPLESGYLDGNAGSKHVLEKLGFVPSESDPCLFIHKEHQIMVLNYCDALRSMLVRPRER